MASQLLLSKKTVQNHISAFYRKLGVRSRSEAIVKGMEPHLIERNAYWGHPDGPCLPSPQSGADQEADAGGVVSHHQPRGYVPSLDQTNGARIAMGRGLHAHGH